MTMQRFKDAVESIYRDALGAPAGEGLPSSDQAQADLLDILQKDSTTFFEGVHEKLTNVTWEATARLLEPSIGAQVRTTNRVVTDGNTVVPIVHCISVIFTCGSTQLISQLATRFKELQLNPTEYNDCVRGLQNNLLLGALPGVKESYMASLAAVKPASGKPPVVPSSKIASHPLNQKPGDMKAEAPLNPADVVQIVNGFSVKPLDPKVELISSPSTASSIGHKSLKKITRETVSSLTDLIPKTRSSENIQTFCDALHDETADDPSLPGNQAPCFEVVAQHAHPSAFQELFTHIQVPLNQRLQGENGEELLRRYETRLNANTGFVSADHRAAVIEQLKNIRKMTLGSPSSRKEGASSDESKAEPRFDLVTFERLIKAIHDAPVTTDKGDAALTQNHRDLLDLLARCTTEAQKQAFYNALDQVFITLAPGSYISAYTVLFNICPESMLHTVITTLLVPMKAEAIQRPQLRDAYWMPLDSNSTFDGRDAEDITAKKAALLALIFPTAPAPKKSFLHSVRDHFLHYGRGYRLLIGVAVALFVTLVLFVPGLNGLVLSGALLAAAKWVIAGGFLHGLAGVGIAIGAGAVAAYLDYVVASALWIVGETVKGIFSHITQAVNWIGKNIWAFRESVKGAHGGGFPAFVAGVLAVITAIPSVIMTGLAMLGEGMRWCAWVLFQKNTEQPAGKSEKSENLPKNYAQACRDGDNLFVSSNDVVVAYAKEVRTPARNERNPEPLSEAVDSASSPAPF